MTLVMAELQQLPGPQAIETTICRPEAAAFVLKDQQNCNRTADQYIGAHCGWLFPESEVDLRQAAFTGFDRDGTAVNRIQLVKRVDNARARIIAALVSSCPNCDRP